MLVKVLLVLLQLHFCRAFNLSLRTLQATPKYSFGVQRLSFATKGEVNALLPGLPHARLSFKQFGKPNADTIDEKVHATATVAPQVTVKTIKKLLPLGLMLFFMLFNYTILRDTKDVLVITAPGSGAEIIPFLKTYVNLPSAIGFTVLYSFLCNRMSPDKVFYLVLGAFLTFFGAFAGLICKLLRFY